MSGVVSSVVVVFLLYKLQQPKFRVSVSDDKYDSKFESHYVHLRVKNVSKPFMGGGTAVNCRGRISIRDHGTFITKWATRANPVRTEIISDPTGPKAVYVAEPAYLEQAKNEYIRPGEEKVLDVAVRFKGDSACYIHEPENFTVPGYKPEKAKLAVGDYPFDCVLEYDGGKSPKFRFKIVNEEGDSPGLLRLETG